MANKSASSRSITFRAWHPKGDRCSVIHTNHRSAARRSADSIQPRVSSQHSSWARTATRFVTEVHYVQLSAAHPYYASLANWLHWQPLFVLVALTRLRTPNHIRGMRLAAGGMTIPASSASRRQTNIPTPSLCTTKTHNKFPRLCVCCSGYFITTYPTLTHTFKKNLVLQLIL